MKFSNTLLLTHTHTVQKLTVPANLFTPKNLNNYSSELWKKEKKPKLSYCKQRSIAMAPVAGTVVATAGNDSGGSYDRGRGRHDGAGGAGRRRRRRRWNGEACDFFLNGK